MVQYYASCNCGSRSWTCHKYTGAIAGQLPSGARPWGVVLPPAPRDNLIENRLLELSALRYARGGLARVLTRRKCDQSVRLCFGLEEFLYICSDYSWNARECQCVFHCVSLNSRTKLCFKGSSLFLYKRLCAVAKGTRFLQQAIVPQMHWLMHT